MKRVLFIIVLLCLTFSAASSESITRMPYSYIDGEDMFTGYYTGEINCSIPEGYGLFEDKSGEWHYIGCWENGFPSGNGTIYEVHNTAGRNPFAAVQDSKEDFSDYDEYYNVNAPYIGNRHTKKFHFDDCYYANEIEEANRIYFSSVSEAIREGYSPCKKCKP